MAGHLVVGASALGVPRAVVSLTAPMSVVDWRGGATGLTELETKGGREPPAASVTRLVALCTIAEVDSATATLLLAAATSVVIAARELPAAEVTGDNGGGVAIETGGEAAPGLVGVVAPFELGSSVVVSSALVGTFALGVALGAPGAAVCVSVRALVVVVVVATGLESTVDTAEPVTVGATVEETATAEAIGWLSGSGADAEAAEDLSSETASATPKATANQIP